MPIISLNGNEYVIDESFIQDYVSRLSPSYRPIGIQQRSDDSSVNRLPRSSFPLGIGFQRMVRETGKGVGGMLDSTCWTHNSVITLGPLQETQTHASPAHHIRRAVIFKGDLWGAFEEDYADDDKELTARKFGATSDNWTGGGDIAGIDSTTHDAAGLRVFDLAVHKSKMYCLRNGGPNTTNVTTTGEITYGIHSSVDGATWADAGGTGFPDASGSNRYITTTTSRRHNHDDDEGRLVSFGNRLLAAIYRDPDATDGDGNVEVVSTTDAGANWASDVTIPSGSGPKAFVNWLDLDGNRSPVLVLAEGVYSVDATNNLFELIYALDGDPASGRWAEVGNDGALYLGLGSGDIVRLAITDTGHLDVIRVGPSGDGLVTARQGHANYFLKTPTKWMLVAYGGHAGSKDASIFMIDTQSILTDPDTGERFMPMHHMYQHATSNLDITYMSYSTEDDATPRLHFAVEGAATDILLHIEEPFANPLLSTTVQYQAQSILRFPYDDLGDPQTTSTVAQVLVVADDLTAGSGGSGGSGDEFIAFRFGVNGASDTTTSLGDFLSGQRTLTFGSGAGVAARRLGRNLLFDRSTTTTNTPKMLELELQAQNLLVGKRKFQVAIDVEKTAKLRPPTVVANTPIQETIITNIEAVATSTTFVAFEIARTGTLRMKVPNDTPPVMQLRLVDATDSGGGYRTGFITITLEEGI
jgi:hypothetical protein